MDLTLRRCAIAATLALMAYSASSIGAGDTYYRWLDATGAPVNSDRPPPAGIEYDVITTNTNEMVNERTAEAGLPENATASPDSDTRQQSTSKQTSAPEKDAQACATAQNNLETLQTHARIRIHDADGNFHFLNEEEKTQQLANSEAAITYYCE